MTFIVCIEVTLLTVGGEVAEEVIERVEYQVSALPILLRPPSKAQVVLRETV